MILPRMEKEEMSDEKSDEEKFSCSNFGNICNDPVGLLQDELSKEQKNSLRERIANTGPDFREKINDEQWETYLKNPSATASWYTDYESPLAGAMTENHQNAVILDATILITANYDS